VRQGVILPLSPGSTYADPIKPTQSEQTLAERQFTWTSTAAKLERAKTVIIVGAGPVGVELAGEILTVYPDKRVTFVDMATTILPGFDEAAATYSRAWLELRGVELMGGEPIERIGADTVLLKSGIELTADVVCATRPAHCSFDPRCHSCPTVSRCQLQVRWGDAQYRHAQRVALRSKVRLQKLD
jgi:NADPH-dependent 2,4-dienoyl-CoA reductase/sulfur reductase-like enzyme|tara:strand:- start:129 stop:683 length:555 start_codon:yes stop_codon:yes gene_type:complete